MPFDKPFNETKISPKILKATKVALENEHGREFSDEEVLKVAKLLHTLAGISVANAIREQSWKEKLIEFPKGYQILEDGFSCHLCHTGVNVGLWYDKYGLKCMHCQKAVESGLIPGTLVEDHELFYTEAELSKFWNVQGKVLTQWIRNRILKARIIPHFDKPSYKHIRIFLMADNPGFLPPKNLLRFEDTVECEINGEIVQKHLKWYQCCDPFEYLKGYGIMNYMRRVEYESNENEVFKEPPKVECCKPISFSGKMTSYKAAQKIKRVAKRKG